MNIHKQQTFTLISDKTNSKKLFFLQTKRQKFRNKKT